MAKHLNISLGVTADTSKAKAQLQDLQNQLTKIINSPTSNRMDLAKEIREASQAAAELQAHLKNATNVDTGTLDFTKLSNSLKQSGQTLESYAQKLVRVGPEGRQTFQQLTTSVAQSEIPIKRVNKQLTEMWTTLKNSARWQISSSILHGFMGAVSSAYGYAQDLNESLTNIRIVTGQNTDQMAKFAKQANAAAKALSTTTTRYTNASLIYYQQGLSDEEVKKRTDITVKMANAAGASAETVSDQLTAVWNNFYDGTKSLEHYADVMTALGAATASSTDEIAGGLEKFAAVADTIGLSYEYAASALATITSNTRQSEEVVGTALKTIFARIQGLNLGETLEDGTSLNKYSEALAKVGIDIFEVNGEIKKMDNILNELGAKWQQLGKDQQIALAQTVAGVRQYNQLVSFMDNWDNGDNDSFQANLNTAQNSEGALQEQADIYAEGWEAASDRVRASMEGIYETIVDDDMFIGILDGLAEIVQYTDHLIDGMGGLGGVISTVGAISMKVFSKQMAQQLRDSAYSLSMMTEGGREKQRQKKQDQLDNLTNVARQANSKNKSEETEAWIRNINRSANLQENFDKASKHMTPEQAMIAQANMDEVQRRNQAIEEKAAELDAIQNTNKFKEQFVNNAKRAKKEEIDFRDGANISKEQKTAEINKTAENISKQYDEIKKKYSKDLADIEKVINKNTDFFDAEDVEILDRLTSKNPELQKVMKSGGDWSELATISDLAADDIFNFKKVLMDEVEQALREIQQDSGEYQMDEAQIKRVAEGIVQESIPAEELRQMEQDADEFAKNSNDAMNKMKPDLTDWADRLVAVSDAAFTLTSSIEAIKGINDIINDDTLSDWDKFSSILSVLTMNIPMLVNSATNLGKAFGGVAGITQSLNAAALKLVPGFKAATLAEGGLDLTTKGLVHSMSALWSSFLPVLGILVVIGGAALAWNWALHENTREAEKAAKSAENLANAYDKAKEAHEEFKSGLSKYEEAQQGLEGLVKGTDEYRRALQEANDIALELINNNPELADQYYFDKDGLLKINSDALKNAENSKAQSERQAYGISLYSKQISNEANVKAQEENLRNSTSKYDVFTDELFDKLYNAYKLDNSLLDKIEAKENDEVAKLLGVSEGVAASLYQHREAIKQLVIATNNNEATQRANNVLMAEAQFGTEIDNTELKDSSQTLLANILGQKTTQYADSGKIEEYVGMGRESQEAFLANYAKSQGYDYSFNSVTGNGALLDSEGKKVQELSLNDLSQIYAYQEAIKEVTKEFPDLTTIVKEGTKNLTDAQTEALSTFANGEIGDLSKLTADEIKSLGESIGISLDEFGNEISNETTELEKVLNNGQDIGDAFAQAKANIEQAKAEYVNSLAIKSETTGLISRSIQDAFNSLDTSNVSLEGSKAIGNVLKNAFIEGGSEGLTVAQNLFAEAGDKAGEVANIVGSIDWQTATVETLNERLIDAGIHIPKASGALAEFVDWINKVRGAASAASNSEFYNSTQEILEQMKSGGTITKEQLDYLRNSDNADIKALAGNFQYNADGTFGFKGTNADVYKAEEMLNQEYHNRFGGSAKEFAEEAQNIKSLESIDINKLTNDQKILAIESLMSGALTEAEAVQFAELRELNPEEITGKRQKELNNILNAHSDLYNQDSINAAYEDKMFESQMNMQADLSLAENEEEVKKWLETYKEVPGAVDAAKKQLQELNNELLADELGIEKEKIDQVAKSYMDMGMSAETAYRQAENHLRLNDGLEKLKDNWKEYSTVLKDTRPGAESTAEYIQTFEELQNILSNITGISKKEIFTKDWVKKNIKAIEQVSKGSEKALDDIQDQFAELRAQEAVLTVVGETDFDNIDPALQALSSELAAFEINNDIKVGATLDAGPMIDGLNKVLAHTNWTKEQIKACLLEMGYDAEVHMVETEYTWDVPIFEAVNDDGSGISSNSPIDAPNATSNGITGTRQITGKIQVPAIRTITKTGQSFGGNVNVSNSSAGGGGGSSDEPTQMEYTKEIDFYDRYKEWDDALDDIDDVLSDIQKEEEVLYGQNKISAMKKHNKMLLEEVEALQQKKKEALAYFEIDKQNLQNAAGALGYNIDFGSRDQILNYTSTMQGLFDELHAMEVHFNSLGSGKAQQQYKKDVLDPFNQKVDDLKQYIDQYDETRELLEDLDNEITDSVLEWKGLNYDILHYELEIKVEINDIALTRLDYYLKKYEDDFYSLSEAAATLFDKLEPTLNKLKAYDEFYTDTTKVWDSTTQQYGEIMEGVTEATKEANEERLDAMSGGLVGAFSGEGIVNNNVEDYYKQTANGKPIGVGESGYIDALSRDITQADYAEGLKEVIEGMYEELGNLDEIDKQFMEFYGQALEMAREELEFYTGSLEHLTNSLKHYNKVAEITGRTNDSAFNKKMLDAQAKMVENQLSVASSNYEMYKQQQEYWKAQLATAAEGSAEWELYQENLKEATKATQEAQEEMLSKTEEWAEALRAILENNLTDAARILENALTGGTSFDAMNTAMERAESLQEEYLTDTNKIYETTKLMRQAQQELDRTTNNSSKLRLSMFITETEQLQQQNRLSEYELSIQQAKYQLLLAELALEEAKNSKSTVRLQRDFEGNFGYVYTADQDQIDDALQNLDDKRNELYNIGLEGANNYTSKYLSTLSAMYDEFTNIQQNYLNGMYESEQEYQDAMTDAYEYYFEQLRNYEELYGIAIRADSRVTADAWSTDFQDMIYSTEIWADECDVYISQVTELFEEWGETSDDLNQILDDTTGTIDEMVRASDELAKITNDNIIPGLQKELDLLNGILKAYGLIRDQVLESQKYYEDQAAKAEQDLREEAERDDYDDDDDFEQEYPTKADRNNKKETGGTGKASTGTTGNKPLERWETTTHQYVQNTGNTSTTGHSTATVTTGYLSYDNGKTWVPSGYKDVTYNDTGKKDTQDDDRDVKKSPVGSTKTVTIRDPNTGKTTTKKEKFATGGYTGEWGPEGKLAILHEKEIVLNKSDTENILQAVDMVRQISTGIDQQVSYQRIATLITQTLQEKKDNDVLEQHVTIEARFDNVRDRYEIEAAFDNLINKASQYANRNKI